MPSLLPNFHMHFCILFCDFLYFTNSKKSVRSSVSHSPFSIQKSAICRHPTFLPHLSCFGLHRIPYRIPTGSATITDLIQPTKTLAVDSQQFAHSEPSFAISMIFFTTSVGLGKNKSLISPP